MAPHNTSQRGGAWSPRLSVTEEITGPNPVVGALERYSYLRVSRRSPSGRRGVAFRRGCRHRESATGELAESGRLHPSRKRETTKVVREFKSLTRRAVVGTRGSVRTVLVDSLILW